MFLRVWCDLLLGGGGTRRKLVLDHVLYFKLGHEKLSCNDVQPLLVWLQHVIRKLDGCVLLDRVADVLQDMPGSYHAVHTSTEV